MNFSKGSLQVPNILGAVEEVKVPFLKDPPTHVMLDKSLDNAPRAIDYGIPKLNFCRKGIIKK